ncbi:sensor domain-containing diguanylate cyclase [Thalassotalea sp. G2M2-11]|uniref:sensor domain-containing diguanylate cyclase n=1 Tax=Thalassotalea sp. G2M2-11 TaxID=2787627 RepID=UPI0019D1020F|nr:sensor domain-containing diguanylate cyclase [Thalassotalea sp. G2M2-11]
MRKRILLIIGLFVLVNVFLHIIGRIQADVMNNVRSYVRGEGLYAKAQKDAVFYLQKYVAMGNEQDYQAYLDKLNVPLGDRQARMLLMAAEPDRQQITLAFLQGENHIDDIPGMIQFYQRFNQFPYVREAIELWTEADALIIKLQAIGEQIRQAKVGENNQPIADLLDELYRLNQQLSELEIQFSLVLSEGARWVKNLLSWITLISMGLMLCVILYISRRIGLGIEKTERELLISESRFKALYRTEMLGIIEWHLDGQIFDANDAFLNMIGYSRLDLSNGRVNWRDLTPESGYARDEVALKQIAKQGYCTPFEKEFIHYDGKSLVPVYVGAALFDGDEERGICFIIDHTEIRKAHEDEQLLATVFNASSDGILICNNNREILAVNNAWCRMKGYTELEVIGKQTDMLIKEGVEDNFHHKVWQNIEDKSTWQGDVIGYKKDGNELHVQLGVNAIRDENHSISHVVMTYTDISEHIMLENKLREMAHYDFLTGLVNRSLFNDLLKRAIERAKRYSTVFAVLFIDLDNFKPINDVHGHEVGDELLREIAQRYQGSVRGNDIVSRFGGDEFIILLDEINQSTDVNIVADKLIQCTNQPINIAGHTLRVGCSIGVSFFPNDGEDGKTLLHNADEAMYAVKATGRNNYLEYSSLNS